MHQTVKQYLPIVFIAILAVAFYVGIMSTLVFKLQPPLIADVNIAGKTPNVETIIYIGEISSSTAGFGTSKTNLTSPGPTLRYTVSDVVSITVVNMGEIPRAFAITSVPQTGANVRFNSQVGSASNPIEPGQQATVVFIPNNAGSFFYTCPLPGDSERGIYGSVIITGKTS